MTEKKKLRMLPEVLPKPTRVAGPSNVRARALARLSVLAALGAVSSGCGGKGSEEGPYGVVDPLPFPTGGSGGRGVTNPSPPVGSAGAYGVVDPLPQPAVCFEGGLQVSADYVRADGLDAGAPPFAAPDGSARADASAPDATAADAGSSDAGGGYLPIALTVLSPPNNIGRAVSLTPGVQIVSQVGSGAGQALTLLIQVPSGTLVARIELPVVCGNRADRYRIELVLQADSVLATAQPE